MFWTQPEEFSPINKELVWPCLLFCPSHNWKEPLASNSSWAHECFKIMRRDIKCLFFSALSVFSNGCFFKTNGQIGRKVGGHIHSSKCYWGWRGVCCLQKSPKKSIDFIFVYSVRLDFSQSPTLKTHHFMYFLLIYFTIERLLGTNSSSIRTGQFGAHAQYFLLCTLALISTLSSSQWTVEVMANWGDD